MGYDYHSLPFDKRLQCLLHLIFIFRIGESGRLVKDKNGRIFQYGSCHAYSLSLSAGKICPFLSDTGTVSFRQAAYEIVALGRFCGSKYLFFRCFRTSYGDVLIDRIVKQE